MDAISGSASAVISMVLIVAGVVWIVLLMVTRAKGGQARPPAAPWRRVATSFGALVVIVFVISRLHLHPAKAPPAKQGGNGKPAQAAAGPVHHHGVDVYIWMGVVLLVTAVVVAIAIRRARREAALAQPDPDERDASPFTAAVSALTGDQDPRTLVIDAYDAMEGALARPVRARAQDTPTEWLEKIAQERPWLRRSAAELTALFERARFSQLPVTESDALRAADLLTGMDADLRPEVGAQ